MTDPGLTRRLRQQSRRAGLAVGLAMALTIAVCVGGFIVIYAKLDPFTRDFVSITVTATPTAEEATQPPQAADKQDGQAPPAQPTQPPIQQGSGAAADKQDGETPTEAAPTPTSTAFTPTHTSNNVDRVNFRSGPSTDSDIITSLDPGTPLKATGQRQQDDSGTTWLEFETADGTKGWIREIDANPVG